KKANTEDTEGQMLERKVEDNFHKYKILDTSVIIDGRIYDIAKTGFLEGVLLIPNFVLYELQYIADSGDSLKRVRGRRGLDILNALQKEEGISVEMYDGDFEDISEVDSKLIKLAKLLDGVVVTNDYNLNKVSEFQNVPVLNINALANAVKPVVIPGETMNVMVVKAGTERQQGVAYLDDGTMVVVEDGQHYMNEQIEVVVTSALQTAAGRMIFAKPAHAGRGINDRKDNHPKNDKN
ncbi:MAG: PIN domain nuclease, partial [Enterococcus faecalis]|nr:PIN domain nuclease [Enterococcus faecalis]